MVYQILRLVNGKVLFPIRYKFLANKLSSYLKNSSKIIDVGSSNGKLSYLLIQKKPHLDITGIDTHILSQQYIHIDQYDGKHLPYADGAFDTAMVIDVLHHDDFVENLVREITRVSSKYVLIKDHFYESSTQFKMLKIADRIGNAPYGINLPFNYLTMDEWHTLFKKLHLKIIKHETFYYAPIDITNNVIFLLEKI